MDYSNVIYERTCFICKKTMFLFRTNTPRVIELMEMMDGFGSIILCDECLEKYNSKATKKLKPFRLSAN